MRSCAGGHATGHRQVRPRPAPSTRTGRAWTGQNDSSFSVQGISTRHAGEAHPVSAGRGRQPDRPRPGLGVAQIQVPFAIVGPFEGEDFVAAATGQEQQPDRCGLKRMIRFMPTQYGAEPLHFFRREKALPATPPVSPDTDTGVGTFRAIAVQFGLPEENAEHGRSSGRRRRESHEARRAIA